ncbi:hypothetical protein [Flavobacterium sp. 3HN19-14]|uniref:DUF7948 domain-containing protein n=1 Tax=Flavobacterium sp. 3HN19-14 TaxID=3448133 RepID=UPI003EE40CE9
MKHFFACLLCIIIMPLMAQNNKAVIGFIENKGQIVDQKGRSNDAVKYLLNTEGLNVQLRTNGFSYDIYSSKKILTKSKKNQNLHNQANPSFPNDIAHKFHRIDIDFLNSNPEAQFITEGKLEYFENYYNIPGKPEGITGVNSYQKITYKDIYPKIDVCFFIPNDPLKVVEYNFIVNPGGNISDIQLHFKGAKTRISQGKISMKTKFGIMEEVVPCSWFENDTEKKKRANCVHQVRK